MEDELINIWDKGRKIEGLDPDQFRKDACGALMIFSKYGKNEDEFGWDIDHIYPVSKGGNEDLINLRPMHVKNIKSKGEDYPFYFRAVKMDNNRNVEDRAQCRVSETLFQSLKKIYG